MVTCSDFLIGYRVLMFLTALVLFPSMGVASNVLYVAVDGSDNQPGTERRPLATIQAAIDRADSGDVIRVGPGAFREQIVINRSGTEAAPIIIEGTRGPGGERLTQINAGEVVPPDTWMPAPDIGPNVFRNESFSYEPGLLTIDGLFVPHLHRRTGRAMEILGWPDDHRETTRYDDISVPFWEVTGGIYTFDPDEDKQVTYLRLAGGVDPRDHTVAISTGPAIAITNAQHIVLRGMEIAGGEIGVQIEGKAAQHNVVDDCFVVNGRRRIYLTAGASHNTIRNSRLKMGYVGARTGAWMKGSTEEAGIRQYVYLYFKYFAGPGNTSDDRSIMIDHGVENTEIISNHIEGGLIGIEIRDASGVMIRGNRIQDFSSVGIALRDSSYNVHIDGNLISNCNINIRPHNLNLGSGHLVYIYRNRLLQEGDLGAHIFCHAVAGRENQSYSDPRVVIYHNTMVGGNRAFNLPSFTSLGRGLSQLQMINNVFAADVSVIGNFPMDDPEAVDVFDYNWIGGRFSTTFHRRPPAWVGKGNIIDPDTHLFSDNALSDVTLPQGSAARNAGIDLSKPFTINGQTYDPLPGMERGYFSGERPDMGAVQHHR